MITALQAKEIYDRENAWRGDEAIHVKDAGDFYVIVPKLKACMGIAMVTKEGVYNRNTAEPGTLKKCVDAKIIF